jgi:hypothetical protein
MPKILANESIHESHEQAEKRAEHYADQLAEAIRNGGCPNCGTAIGIIHEEPDGEKFRQCGYCGNRYPVGTEAQKSEPISSESEPDETDD